MQRKGTVNGIINALGLIFLRESGAPAEKEPLLGYDDALPKVSAKVDNEHQE